jgi:hypothetical protein
MMKVYLSLFSFLGLGAGIAAFVAACGGSGSAPFNSQAFNEDKKNYLYVASGACYGGGVATTAGPSNTVARYDLKTGTLDKVVIDYSTQPGDQPVAMSEFDDTRIQVAVENAAGRKVQLVRKDGGGATDRIVNATALNGIIRGFAFLNDFSVLVSKSTAIEKFGPSTARVLQGANPFVNAPAAPCATSTTLVSSVAVSTTGKIIYTHAAATPNNRIGVIRDTGYAIAADCLASVAGPTTTALPTRVVFHPDGRLLVAYGSTTAASNFIYSYTFNDTSGAIAGATVAYNNNGIVNGPSSMAVDPDTKDVFVANVTAGFNTVERFTYNAGVLTRVPGPSFILAGAYTRCIADLKVMK